MSDDNDPIEVPEPKCPICDGTGINTYIEKDEIGLNIFAHYPCQCRKESREDEGYDLLKTLEHRLISEFVSDLDKILLWNKIHLVDVMEKWEEKLK